MLADVQDMCLCQAQLHNTFMFVVACTATALVTVVTGALCLLWLGGLFWLGGDA